MNMTFLFLFLQLIDFIWGAVQLLWRSENSPKELVLSFHVGPGNQTQAIRSGEKTFMPWAIYLIILELIMF